MFLLLKELVFFLEKLGPKKKLFSYFFSKSLLFI
jgi:hypothetical protein